MQPLLIATRKGLFVAERNTQSWRITSSHFQGIPVTMTLCDPRDGSWYAALEHGHFGPKLHRSSDRGETWTEIGTPTYPEKPEDSKDQHSWSLKTIWSLEIGGQDQEGTLWCGSLPGGLFHSSDKGANWELCTGLWNHPDRLEWFGGGADVPGLHSIVVDPRNSDRLLIAVSCGGIWESEDAGAHWQVRSEGMRANYMPPEKHSDPVIQDPHILVACPTSPDSLWTQHHCGIWKSTDGAKSWQEVEQAGPSTFGFAVAVHPNDAAKAWFVPAISDELRIPVDSKFVVTRTSDGGASFDILRQGLPTGDAYDLCFRHALDIDHSGDHLALGSTTGSVWTTSDQGDNWELLSSHLPPVYSIRFG